MTTFITVFGLTTGPLALAFVLWCLLAEIGRVRDITEAADIERIKEGLPDPAPEPVEEGPFRRIAWEVDEEFEAMVRSWLWPTQELARIKALVGAGIA